MEMIKVKYSINFFNDWHAGSGLSAGAKADATIIKNEDNLPYLPGKTMKGLVKDALLLVSDVQRSLIDLDHIADMMGGVSNTSDEISRTKQGRLRFSNAELCEQDRDGITNDLEPFLYRRVSSTSIDKNGVTKDGSLRSLEVCIPCLIEGYIDCVKEEDIKYLEMAFQLIRRVGVNRNRGLGRCKIEFKII